MQKAKLRVGDVVGYTTYGPRSHYRSVELKAVVMAFRDEREGIGIAIHWGDGTWSPRWVSGQYIMCFWEEHQKELNRIREARRVRQDKAKAHSQYLKGLLKRANQVGIAITQLVQSRGSTQCELHISEEDLIKLLERLEAVQPDDQEWQ